MRLRLPFRAPMTVATVLDFHGAHAIPGVERYAGGVFTRVFPAPGGPAVVALAPGGDAVELDILHAHPDDTAEIEARVRHLLDLDADPGAVDEVLGAEPALAPLVRTRPGLRAPGTVDPFETAVRTIVGQQNSVIGSRTVLGRIVAAHGSALDDTWTLFPSPAALAVADPETLPMPRARGRAIVGLAQAVADGSVAFGPEVAADDLRATLLALRGIGPWTVDYLAMRVRKDPDVLLTTDLVVRRAAADLGVDLADGVPAWAPWRTYATYHLWAHLYADAWSAS